MKSPMPQKLIGRGPFPFEHIFHLMKTILGNLPPQVLALKDPS